MTGNARLAKSVDVLPGEPIDLSVEATLQAGDRPYLTFENPTLGVFGAGGAKYYKGPGLAILNQRVEGPLHETWPPRSSRQLLEGLAIEPDGDGFRMSPPERPLEAVRNVLAAFVPRAFRRPVSAEELEAFVELARPALEDDRAFLEAVMHYLV